MGMSAWTLFAAPLLAHSAPLSKDATDEEAGRYAAAIAVESIFEGLDVIDAAAPASAAKGDEAFAGLVAMDETAMSAASGGAKTTVIDIGGIGVNNAENNGLVANIDAGGATTGVVDNLTVSGNGGITTVFVNTGIGAVLQSNVNINLFMDGAAAAQN